jgi:hypothetical protein
MILKFEFVVNPEQIAIARCKVSRPFKVHGYEIDKRSVYISSIAFDEEVFEKIVDSWGMVVLDYDWKIDKDFSFVVDGCSLAMPEKVKVSLIGEYV